MRKLAASLFVIAAAAFSALPASAADSRGERVQLPSWRHAAGDGAGREASGFDDSGWADLALPGKATLRDGVFWLRGRLPAPLPKDGVRLVIGRLDGAASVYLNGTLVGERGAVSPRLKIPTNEPSAFLLPSALLAGDGSDLVAVRVRSPASSISLRAFYLGDSAAEAWEKDVVGFFNYRLYAILAALCAFIGIYFFLLWVERRSDRYNLWYALSTLAIAIYFNEMGSSFALLPYSMNRALAKACLVPSLAALVAFFVDFFKLKAPRPLGPALLGICALDFLGYFLVREDLAAMGTVFLAGLLFVQAAIVFAIYSTVRAVVRGDREAIPMVVGVGLGVAFGTHDVVYMASGAEPVAWLQGVGFFFLNLSLFVTLTLRSGRLHAELERYSADVEDKTRALSDFVANLGLAADSVSALAEQVDADAESTAASAEKLAVAAEWIGGNAERQAEAASASEASVARLGESLASVREGVDAQARGAADAAAAVTVIAREAASVADAMARTSDFARSLDGTAGQGRKAARALDEAIGRIRETAGAIGSVVDAVSDFAERTNLLAMNAAIEAAHSGAAGRGFAVIANEIKSLASASAERAARIRESVAEISARIDNGVEANGRVRAALDSVAEGASAAASGIAAVGDSFNAQKAATDRLRQSLEALSAASDAIRREAENQQDDGRQIRERMGELAALSSEVRSSIADMVRENASIAEAIKHLAQVSRDGKDAAMELRELTASRAAP